MQQSSTIAPDDIPAIPWEAIEAAIKSIRHGTVQIVIREGVVVQIDRTEKHRLR